VPGILFEAFLEVCIFSPEFFEIIKAAIITAYKTTELNLMFIERAVIILYPPF